MSLEKICIVNFFIRLFFYLEFVKARPVWFSSAVDNNTEATVLNYLRSYGYVSQDHHITGSNEVLSTAEKGDALKKAQLRMGLLRFQKFMKFPETGIIDQEIVEFMKKTRCSEPDLHFNRFSNVTLKALLTTRGQRKRRNAMQFFKKHGYNQGTTYDWYIDRKQRSKKLPFARNFIEYGINLWAAAADIKFQNRYGYGYADIVFAFYTGDHGDGKPFDGAGGKEEAHSFPNSMKVHFDDDEAWQLNHRHIADIRRPGKTPDLVQVAAHQMGHVLGLQHSSSNKSVMYPTVDGGIANAHYALSLEDIARIKALYGKCDPDKFDAIFSNFRGDGRTYIIVGPFVYLFDDHKVAVDPNGGWPKNSYHFWRGGFNLFDDIFHGDNNRLYYFYTSWYYFDIYGSIDSYWWAIDTKKSGINAGIVGWPGLAGKIDRIDAAFKHTDGRVYIFRGDKVYRWDFNAKSPYEPHFPPGQLEKGWPKNISDVFPGVPNDIDTVFRRQFDNKVYFFKGLFFYIWDEKKQKADGLYPIIQWKNVCDVIRCTGALKCRSWKLNSDNCGRMCQRG